MKVSCSRSKYIVSSTQSDYIIVIYDETNYHTCGDADFVIDPTIVNELEQLFENNLNLKPSQAYRQLFAEKSVYNGGLLRIFWLLKCF